MRDLLQNMRIDGSADALAGREVEELQRIGQAVMDELDHRQKACGGADGAYPFDVKPDFIQLRPGQHDSTYVFLLLLSVFGKDACSADPGGERIFEDLCSDVGAAYLDGHRGTVGARVFGFPRRIMPKGFVQALDRLCGDLGEGTKHRRRPNTPDQKDAKLDIVVWKEFPDRFASKLIGFGQCATGGDWDEKKYQLQPAKWCEHWMDDCPTEPPFRMFFVPHRIPDDKWLSLARFGGIIFDRFRIAYCAEGVNVERLGSCKRWATLVRNGTAAQGATTPASRAKSRKKKGK